MAAGTIRRFSFGMLPMLGLFVLLLVSLSFMSDATHNSESFSQMYSVLLFINAAGLVILGALVVATERHAAGVMKGWSASPTTTARQPSSAAAASPARSEVICPSAHCGLWRTVTWSARPAGMMSGAAPVITITGPIAASRTWASDRSITVAGVSAPFAGNVANNL